MSSRLGTAHESLRAASRLRPADGALTALETAALVLCGSSAAALVMLLETKLKLPGHSILRAVFPMTFGLALVPRHGAGSVMGASAIGTAAILLFTGAGERGLGALTSLCLIGPMLDFSVRRTTTGRWVYLSLIAAGVLTNLAAFAVQTAAKSFGWDEGGGKSVMAWLPFAAVTYPTSGALAGLLSALAWFRWSGGRPERSP